MRRCSKPAERRRAGDGGGGVRIGGGGDACRPASDASAICCGGDGVGEGRGGRAREGRGWAARAGEGRREAACASSSRRSTGTEVTERPSTCGGRSGAHGGWRCDPGRKRRKVAGAQARVPGGGASPRAPPLPRAAAVRGPAEAAWPGEAAPRRPSPAAAQLQGRHPPPPPQLLRSRNRSPPRWNSVAAAQPSARRRADPQTGCAWKGGVLFPQQQKKSRFPAGCLSSYDLLDYRRGSYPVGGCDKRCPLVYATQLPRGVARLSAARRA